MNRSIGLSRNARILLAAAMALLALIVLLPASRAAETYVCPPCGSPCDTLTFDHPGTCPTCGMTLVPKSSLPRDTRRRAAILIFDGVEIIDYTGPYEILGADNYDVYTVAAGSAPITTAMGMKVVPNYTLANAPHPDVLIVPGGSIRSALASDSTLAWVRATTQRDQHTLSVCNGAFILAQAGLLDGLAATTTYHNLVRLQNEYPQVKVKGGVRFVDNGKIITAGGLSAGIDGALHVIALLEGEGAAREVALAEEYDWKPGALYARPLLADRLMPSLSLAGQVDGGAQWTNTLSRGDSERWETEDVGPARGDLQALALALRQELAQKPGWTLIEATGGTSRWTLSDLDGAKWRAEIEVSPAPEKPGQYRMHISVRREARG